MPKKLLLIIFLSCSSCVKRIEVRPPNAFIVINDRINDVLSSNIPPEQKVQIVHDILDREQQRGQNLVSGWKETLAWITTVTTLIVKR